jgi:hypothetical protein
MMWAFALFFPINCCNSLSSDVGILLVKLPSSISAGIMPPRPILIVD